MDQEVEILKRALAREKAARKSAEKILEAKSLELYQISRKLEVLLDEKSNQLQGVFDNIIDAYVIMDLRGTVLKLNEAATKLFGYDVNRDKFNVIDLVHKDDYKYAMNSFRDLQEKGFFKNYKARIYTKSREVKWVHVNASLIFDKNKSAMAAQGIVRDITDLKNLEIQKGKLLTKLEKSNEMLQEYAHIVSHDLKSPLRSIDALVNWIQEDNSGKFDETSLNNFKLIETTLEKMEQLITDVLDYSSIDTKNAETVNVDINLLVNDLIDMLYVPEHIDIKVHKQLPIVKGSKTKLQQLFQNLISNAIKFNDKKYGLIEIGATEELGYLQFFVRDNGMGIDEKFHDKIFKVFHLLRKSKDSNGIGLSIVKKIVELHEGKIWLESELGKGTTFYFTLNGVSGKKNTNRNNRMHGTS